MKTYSNTNTHKDKYSQKSYTSAQIESKNAKAKKRLRKIQIETHGYEYCMDCGKNKNDTYLDVSHQKSKDWCIKNSEIELIWDVNNMRIRCRECHKKYDKLNLQFKN